MVETEELIKETVEVEQKRVVEIPTKPVATNKGTAMQDVVAQKKITEVQK